MLVSDLCYFKVNCFHDLKCNRVHNFRNSVLGLQIWKIGRYFKTRLVVLWKLEIYRNYIMILSVLDFTMFNSSYKSLFLLFYVRAKTRLAVSSVFTFNQMVLPFLSHPGTQVTRLRSIFKAK